MCEQRSNYFSARGAGNQKEDAAARVTWENESLQCTVIDNVCEGTVAENGNPEAGEVKITVNGDEIKGEGADLEGAFTFIGNRSPAPPPGGSITHKIRADRLLQLLRFEHCSSAAYLPRRHC
jgi:hypothetical protein